MKYIKGYRFRLYPNKTQEKLLNKILGCCRFVYNRFLTVRKKSWENEKKSVSYTQTSSMLTQLKKEISWLNEADSIALQQSLRNLDTAYQNFFKHERGYPKFKSKKNHRQTYRTVRKIIRVEGKRIRLPKVGSVKFEQSRNFHGKILSATITKTAAEKYFVSL